MAVDIESTASGDNHAIVLTPTITEAYLTGIYRGTGYVVNGDESERHTVWSGDIEILANIPIAAEGFDTRTKAERILDFIDRSWERVAAKQVVQSNIEGVNLQFRSFDELMRARNYWAEIVANEKSGGHGGGSVTYARFKNAH